jgi:hypoxanthine phosphoribosyltransferase
MRHELLTWDDIDQLIDHLIPQFDHEFEGMVIITRGGIVPGGLLAAALHLENILTASVEFPAGGELDLARPQRRGVPWPQLLLRIAFQD